MGVICVDIRQRPAANPQGGGRGVLTGYWREDPDESSTYAVRILRGGFVGNRPLDG